MSDRDINRGVILDERPVDHEAVCSSFEKDDGPPQIVMREDWLAKDPGQMFEVFAIAFLVVIGVAQLAFTLM